MDAFSEDHTSWRLALSNGMHIHARGLILAVGPTSHPNARIYALAFAADLPDNFPRSGMPHPTPMPIIAPAMAASASAAVATAKQAYHAAMLHISNASPMARVTGSRSLQPQQPTYSWAVDLAVTAAMVPTLRPLSNIVPGYAIEGLGALGVLPGIVLGKRAESMLH